MHSVSSPKILLVLLVSLDVRGGAPVKLAPWEKGFNAPNRDGPFHPCRPSTQVTAGARRRMGKMILPIMSTCFLKVASNFNRDLTLQEHTLKLLPRLCYLACLNIRIVYGAFMNSAGRLPLSIARNASQLYRLGWTIATWYLKDESCASEICDHRNGRFCYPKKKLLKLYSVVIPCAKEAFRDTTPENIDSALFSMLLIGKKMASISFFN